MSTGTETGKGSADEPVLLAIIPDHLRLRAGDPLQHAALLPAPCLGLAKRNPTVVLVQIHHADFDLVFRRRRPMLEADLVAEHEAVVRRELQLVVVAKPMKPRAACDLTDRGKLVRVLSA
jgi:hypothetical protein